MLQRVNSAKSMKIAQKAILLNIPGVILIYSLCSLTGLVIYANYSNCDPLNDPTSGIKNPNQLVPFFVIEKFKNIPCFAGLFLSAIFCASLSSLSTAFNSMAACIWRDYFLRFSYFKEFDDSHSLVTTKLICLFCGIVCTCVAFMIAQVGGNLSQISGYINGAFQSPIIGLFLVASLVPFINMIGLFSGAFFGILIAWFFSFGSFFYKPKFPLLSISTSECLNSTHQAFTNVTILYSKEASNLEGFSRIFSISYLLISPIGVLITIVSAILISLITRKLDRPVKDLDDSLIVYKSFKDSFNENDMF